MDCIMIVIVVVSLISTGSARPTKVRKQRFNLLENRVNTLETRINIGSDNTQDLSDRVIEINATLIELQTVCRYTRTNKTAETETIRIMPPDSFPEVIERVLIAFNEEKVKIRSTADAIENALVDIQHNMTKETDQNIQAGKNDYTDLKLKVQSINLTLMDIQDEIQHYISSNIDLQDELKSNEEKTELLSTELKSNKENTALLVSRLNEMKQDLKDMATSFDNKYEQKKCPTLWSRFDMFCYRLFENKETYPNAKRICKTSGAFVLDIQNQIEQEFVVNLTKYGPVYYWIGLTDIKQEGSWEWDRTHSTPLFLNWLPEQPDNWRGNQDCVYGYTNNRDKWDDIQCSYTCSVICKKPL